MLAKYWRLHVYWVGDQTLTFNDGAAVNVRALPWKLTAGALVYGTVITDDLGFGAGQTIATTGSSEGDVQDNTSNLNIGVKGFFEVIADLTSTDGTAYLYLEESDDNSNWPSDGTDFHITSHLRLVAAVALSTDAVDEKASVNFEF